MYPSYKLMNEIKQAAGGKVGPQSVRRSVELIETRTPIGAVMASVAPLEFKEAMCEVAQGRPREEVLAWMTLAAAGRVTTWLTLAERAVEVVDPDALVGILVEKGNTAQGCERLAEEVEGDEQWGAWLLLSRLRRNELVRLVNARPALRDRYRKARRVHPQIAEQLRALELV